MYFIINILFNYKTIIAFIHYDYKVKYEINSISVFKSLKKINIIKHKKIYIVVHTFIQVYMIQIQCHTMLEIYGEGVIRLIEEFGTKDVCKKIGLCAVTDAAALRMRAP